MTLQQHRKGIAKFCLFLFLIEIIAPLQAYALSGGPSQPEFQSFEPIGTTDMVNMPSGDFQYNIPLLDVGGYPVNLSYHSGITADQEASIVGLGWTVNVGTINRNVRALPDDFKGDDEIVKEFNMLPNRTVGISGGLGVELFGKDLKFGELKLSLNVNMGINLNNYKGIGYEFGLSPSFSAGSKSGDQLTSSLGLNASTKGGVNFSPSLNYSRTVADNDKGSLGIGGGLSLPVNSREGLKVLNLSTDISDTDEFVIGKKTFGISAGTGVNAAFSFAGKSYTPNISMSMYNSSKTFSFKLAGIELFGTNGSVNFSGYISQQELMRKIEKGPAFGTLYAHLGKDNLNALMDFNRENDGAFHDHTVALPTAIRCQDVYSVAGQGIGGSYQLKRADVGVMFDRKSQSISSGNSLGFEIGAFNTFHGGIDFKANNTRSTTRKWKATENNPLAGSLEFEGHKNNSTYEPAYFRAAGEMAVETDGAFYKTVGEDKVVRPVLDALPASSFEVKTESFLKTNKEESLSSLPANVSRGKRQRRNQVLKYLTAKEATKLNVHKMESYPLYEFVDLNVGTGPNDIKILKRENNFRKGHHISEITTLRPDGMRYVFGIPAYNLKKREVTFNVQGRMVDCTAGLVDYTGADDSKGNSRGKDHFFSAVNTPSYAHSYLLTSVLSQDYEDVNQDGLSDDDFGSFTKFNWSRIHDSYNWRVPIEKNKASFSEGLYSYAHDDKGNYVFGEKEIWQLHSIESKTMVAEFYYSNPAVRKDGFGVTNKDGGRDDAHYSVHLDKIVLYSKPDRKKNKDNATPIKTVVFSYDYSLCPGAPNSKANNRGKLTLKKLHFTYGHSQKAALSKYNFKYRNSGESYDMKSYDRWGSYKPNKSISRPSPQCTTPASGDPIPNSEKPYAEQDPTAANDAAGSWCLNQINLPSGGVIKVDYAAKHYAYVQDKSAMRMFDIISVESLNPTRKSSLYKSFPPISSADDNQFKMFVQLDGQINTREELRRKYLHSMHSNDDYVYLKCYTKLNSIDVWEYIDVYAQIEDYGIDQPGDVAWIKLRGVPIKDNSSEYVSPITKYAFQYLRENLPEIAYGSPNVTVDDLENNLIDFLEPFLSIGTQLKQFVEGYNNVCKERGYAKDIDIEGRSYIRLYEPDGIKYGGGAHVKSVIIEDRWGTMTGDSDQNFKYGQEYNYTKIENGDTISSGVAAWEPMIGGEENPHRYPIVVNEERKWAIDNIHYTDLPLAESLMPGPQIVYSKIMVRNIKPTGYDVSRTSTGHSEMEYYTARDFRTIVGNTPLQRAPKRISPIFKLVKIKMKEHMNASQGFYVEKNNMHGQAKAKRVYDEKGTLISKVKYQYKRKANGDLDNEVKVIHPDGTVGKGLLGVDYDMVADARHSKTLTTSSGVNFNTDGFFVGIIPIVVPVPWPSFEQNEDRFRSMTLTKVIQKNGILEKTIAWDLGSEIETENLAYDAETAEVLLTKTFNEFDDPIYNLKLPAHWSYEGMGLAYKNLRFKATAANGVNNGTAITSNGKPFFPGDEIMIRNIPTLSNPNSAINAEKAWVLHVNSNSIYLIDKNGNPVTGIPGPVSLDVIRSGHRNMPTQSIGSITSNIDPIKWNTSLRLNGKLRLKGDSNIDQINKVINAGAIEYDEAWSTYCCENVSPGDNNGDNNGDNSGYNRSTNSINPYTHNLLGAWRPLRSWVHLSERDRARAGNSSTNIRENGTYTNFKSFWISPQYNGSQKTWSPNSSQWTWATSVTKFNPNGTELENVDRLGRYSCETLGYYDMLVTGVAANTMYQQAAFDGFEDYHYNAKIYEDFRTDISCEKLRHFGLADSDAFPSIPITSPIVSSENHTGNYSLLVEDRQAVEMSYPVKEGNCIDIPFPPSDLLGYQGGIADNPISLNPNASPYQVDPCDDCIKGFSPTPDKYVLTAWVRENDGLGATDYHHHGIEIDNGAQLSKFKASGTIIDGWQRIYGEFEIPSTATDLVIRLQNPGNPASAIDHIVYFDDLRIHPFNGSMKNFVYDDVSLKLLAELDDNGYASFYDYDAAGELIRIKKETERGIMTIQESRSSLVKKREPISSQGSQIPVGVR